MKKARKLTAVLLSLVMLLALVVPASAAENYSITIQNNKEGHTYEAYQIFAGTVSSDEATAGNVEGPMLGDIIWGSGVNGDALLEALKEANAQKYNDCTTAADVAEALGTENATAADAAAFADIAAKHLTATVAGTADAPEGGNYVIEGLPAGYYLVKDSLQEDDNQTGQVLSDYIVQVLGNVTMKPKSSDIPTVLKKVQEEDLVENKGFGKGFSDVADHEIGETFQFKLIGSIPDMSAYDTYEYTFHDTMSAGLSYVADSVKAYIVDDYSTDALGTALATNSYTVESLVVAEDGENKGKTNLTISFADLKKVDGAQTGKYVVITFSATLNAQAVMGAETGNPNEVYLEFSNNPNGGGTGKTEQDYAVVFAWTLGADKIDGETEDRLADADFVLLNDEKNKVAILTNARGEIRLSKWVDLPNNKTYDKVTVEEWNAIPVQEGQQVVMTSNTTNIISIRGLDDDIYYLYEIEAPTGYNRITDPIKLDVESTLNHDTSYISTNAIALLTELKLFVNDSENPETCNFKGTGNINFTIENNKGATLPETGGMGTTLFYIIGGLLVVGAGILLVVRIRMKAHNE